MTDVNLPLGALRTNEDGLLAVRFPSGRPEKKQVRAWLERVSAANSRSLLTPRRITERPFGLELEYADDSRRTIPLSAKAVEWAGEMQIAVPQILSLARFALAVAEELAARGIHDVPVGPAFIRSLPGGTPTWRLIPVPTGEAVLADWARADADAWLWAAPHALLEGKAVDAVHVLGAALYHGLAGAIFAETLTRREMFSRLLHGRIGAPARLEAAVRSALPSSSATDADALTALIADCLNPLEGKRPTSAEARRRIEDLEKQFSAERLAGLWEAENRPDLAAKLRETPAPSREEYAPPDTPGESWSDIAKRLRDQGDLTKALEMAWKAIHTEGPAYVRLYLGIVQLLAGRSPRPVAEMAAALERLAKELGSKLDEGDFLRVFHLKVRYLAVADAELGRLDRPYESRWNEGTALLLQAWLLIRKFKGFADVSRFCKEGRQRFEAAPGGGGEAGVYARAYIDLMDGIAHIGYVGAAGQVDYYSDALTHFSQSFLLASKIEAEDVVRACLRWIGCLAQLTSVSDDAKVTPVHLGAQAILQSHGMAAEALSGSGLPEIPGYDEMRMFPI